MTTPLLLALAALVVLGPAVLSAILRRRLAAVPFWKAYVHMLPWFVPSALLKAGHHWTGMAFLDLAAPVAMVAGVLVAVHFLGK